MVIRRSKLHGHFQAARLMLNCNCLNLNRVAAIKARSSPPLSTLYGPVCNRSPHRYAPDPVAGRVVRLPSRASGDSTTIGGALGRRLQLDHPLSPEPLVVSGPRHAHVLLGSTDLRHEAYFVAAASEK